MLVEILNLLLRTEYYSSFRDRPVPSENRELCLKIQSLAEHRLWRINSQI